MPQPLVNLLCLPCAGASATMYLRWRRELPAWVRVVTVELPGRGSRLSEPFAVDFASLVSGLCDEQAQAMAAPYAVFGHSMGALLAHAIAVEQRRRDRRLPCALFAAGCAGPARFESRRFELDDDAALIADLRKQGGTPEEAFEHPELLRMALDTLGRDYQLCNAFRHAATEPLPLPLHALAGRSDDVELERLRAWGRETSDVFTLDWFDGGHFFIREQQQLLLERVVRHLSSHFTSGVSGSLNA
ncbi:MAG: alpha/beta fold hydrolase [Polyangiaceae bacterium]